MRLLKKNWRAAIAGNKPDIIAASCSEADTMTLTTRILAALLFALALAGCGQSGPLYVPGDPSSVQQPQPVPAGDEEGEENGEDDEN